MESEIKSSSRICPITPSSKKKLNRLLRPSPILVAVSLTLILTTAGLVYYWIQPPPYIPPPPPTPLQLTPHGNITIDGDDDFANTALQEGWPGDGSPENPYIIGGLEIDLDGEIGNCVRISNTRASFTITNCNLTGALFLGGMSLRGVGIYLDNVINGKLVNNICSSNRIGIVLCDSDSNTVANNTCNNNTGCGIDLRGSGSNTVANNTCYNNSAGISFEESHSNSLEKNICNNNTEDGICLSDSDYNTVFDNICNNNDIGISLEVIPGHRESDFNTVTNNTCSNNRIGIYLCNSEYNTVSDNISNNNDIGISLEVRWYNKSDFNTVTNNTCSNNRIGIYLCNSEYNTVSDNTFFGNTEHDIVGEYMAEEDGTEEFVAENFVWFLAGCGMILVVSVIAFVQFRRMG